MLYRNKRLDEAFAFIKKCDADIFCLQEVPESFLTRLKTLPFSLSYTIDFERIYPNKIEAIYLVTLTKHQIEKEKRILLPEYAELLPWRTRLFVSIMPNRFFTKSRSNGGLHCDLRVQGKLIRVFNLHITLAQPSWRVKEFEIAMMERDLSLPTVVCGDFNTIEAPRLSVLNWILGGKVSDALFYARERTHIEKRFLEHSLVNALSKKITHPFSRSQLDHILVSKDLSLGNAVVIPEHYGSDHHPIQAEIY